MLSPAFLHAGVVLAHRFPKRCFQATLLVRACDAVAPCLSLAAASSASRHARSIDALSYTVAALLGSSSRRVHYSYTINYCVFRSGPPLQSLRKISLADFPSPPIPKFYDVSFTIRPREAEKVKRKFLGMFGNMRKKPHHHPPGL